jgi:PAS domain S-box-containing protein
MNPLLCNNLNNCSKDQEIPHLHLDKELRINKINPSLEKLLKISQADIGKSLEYIVSKVKNEGLPEDIQYVLKTGNTVEKQVSFKNKKNYILRMFPYLLEGNASDGIVLVFIDTIKGKTEENISEKNHIELHPSKEKLNQESEKLELKIMERIKELMKSEQRFKLLTKATSDSVWVWDLKTDQIFWKDWFKIIFEYQTEVTKKEALFDRIHSADHKRITSGIIKTISSGDFQWSDKFRFLRFDGGYSYVLGRAYVIYNDKNEPLHVLGSMVDLTEIKEQEIEIRESEERIRFIAESMPQKVWTMNAVGNVTYMNERWLFYSGLPFENLKGQEWLNLLHRDDSFEIKNKWKNAIKSGEDFQFEHRLQKEDGEYRWHLTRGIACRNSEGKITGWVVTTTDINDNKISEDKKDEFIGIASHELKTPLTSLKAYSQLLERTIAEKNFKDSASYIKKTNIFINRLDELISDLLDVSKIQAGKLQYNIQSIDFDEMVQDSIESMRHTAKNHKISIKGKAKKTINGDRTRLEQVFVNFISNAIKYSPKSDKVFIHISSDPQQIKVGIQDFGIGIPEVKKKNIFQKFFRVEGMEHKFQGLGLGLYISSEIVQRHGGKCWVESEEEQGSTFWFSLPLNNSNDFIISPRNYRHDSC